MKERWSIFSSGDPVTDALKLTRMCSGTTSEGLTVSRPRANHRYVLVLRSPWSSAAVWKEAGPRITS